MPLLLLLVFTLSGCAALRSLHAGAVDPAEEAERELAARIEAETKANPRADLDSVVWDAETWQERQRLAIAERAERAERRSAALRQVGMGLRVVGQGLNSSMGTPSLPSPRCVSVAPICAPGQNAICMCSSDYEINCAWLCGSISGFGQ